MHTLHTLHTASTAISLEPIMRRDTARALVGALAFGVATQALFWDASIGLNFPLWTALAVGAADRASRARGGRARHGRLDGAAPGGRPAPALAGVMTST